MNQTNKNHHSIPKKIIAFSLLLSILGMGAILYGVSELYRGANESQEHVSQNKAIDHHYEIAVDVGGAVYKPGVYKLPALSRLSQAISAAGGVTSAADVGYVAKQLNGASTLADGQKVYIPPLLETLSTAPAETKDEGVSTTSKTQDLIPINTASQAKLQTLPGIGEKRASDLIDQRPYQTLEELKEKGGLSDKIIADIKDLISF